MRDLPGADTGVADAAGAGRIAEPQCRDEARPLWQEAKELNLIFGAIRRSVEDGRAH